MSILHCLRSYKNIACKEETHISRGCFEKVSSLSLKIKKNKKYKNTEKNSQIKKS